MSLLDPMTLAPKVVPTDKVERFMEVANKPHNFYWGYVRPFLVLPDQEFAIDTRYDDDLRALGLIE